MKLREGLETLRDEWVLMAKASELNPATRDIYSRNADHITALLSTADSEQREGWRGPVRCNKCSKVYATAPSAHYWSWNKHPYPRELCDGTFVPYERRTLTNPAEQREVVPITEWGDAMMRLDEMEKDRDSWKAANAREAQSCAEYAAENEHLRDEVADLRRKLEGSIKSAIYWRDRAGPAEVLPEKEQGMSPFVKFLIGQSILNSALLTIFLFVGIVLIIRVLRRYL